MTEPCIVMGILNITPDSFSDGGRFAEAEAALAHARLLGAEGADWIDVGAESTRPGAQKVEAEDEWARLMPVLFALATWVSHGGVLPPVSVDTYKAAVADRALQAGARMINDVWGLQHDPDMARVVAAHDAQLVIMHNRVAADDALDIVADVRAFFARSLDLADRAGIDRARIWLDPGIGFGKTPEQNLLLLRDLMALQVDQLPLLLGVSRKSYIGRLYPSDPSDRLPGTCATHALAYAQGVRHFRAHDVAACRQTLAVSEGIFSVPQ